MVCERKKKLGKKLLNVRIFYICALKLTDYLPRKNLLSYQSIGRIIEKNGETFQCEQFHKNCQLN